jgi:hypothetical protein
LTGEKLKALLNLVPLSMEGGYFAETYRSPEVVAPEVLAGHYNGARAMTTAIYYMLEPDSFSEMHRLASDEIFHFYLGDPVEMLQLWPDGESKQIVIGPDLERGMVPQAVVPRGVWQGARLAAGGKLALLGCTVSPGFDYADYESGRREALVKEYPQARDVIRALTRE